MGFYEITIPDKVLVQYEQEWVVPEYKCSGIIVFLLLLI